MLKIEFIDAKGEYRVSINEKIDQSENFGSGYKGKKTIYGYGSNGSKNSDPDFKERSKPDPDTRVVIRRSDPDPAPHKIRSYSVKKSGPGSGFVS